MNEEEKFDDLLRSKLEERDFPFDETNWDKAEELIDGSESKRRIGIVALVFLVGVIVGICIMLPFLLHNKPQENNLAIQRIQPIDSTKVHENSNPIVTNNTGLTNTTTQSNSAGNNINASAPATNSNNATAAASSAPKENVNKTNSGKVAANAPEQQYNYVRPESERKKHITHTTQNNNNNSSLAVVNRKKKTNPTTVNEEQKNNVQSNETSGKNNNIAGSNTTVSSSVTATENSNNTSTPLALQNNNVKNTDTTKKTHGSTDTIALTGGPGGAKDTSTTATLVNNNSPAQKPEKYSHTLFSIDAGAGYSPGWQKDGSAQGNGVSPVLGISLTHYFSHKVSLFVGLQYNSLGNINTMYSNSSTQYDFGYNSNINSVTVKTLYYAALPLQIQYSITANNIFTLGITPMYLVNTNSSVVSYQQNYFGVSGNTATMKMGYMDGFNPLDARVTIGYKRKLKYFTIGIEGYYGLMDIENNSFFNNNVFERNSGLRLLFSYDILK